MGGTGSGRKTSDDQEVVDAVKVLSGFDKETLSELATMSQLPYNDVVLAACYCHLNISYEQLGVTAALVQQALSKTTVATKVINVLRKMRSVVCCDPNERFVWSIDKFPSVTCVVDVVNLPIRGGEEMYESKHHAKTLSFCVFTQLNGKPFWWSPAFPGPTHDSEVLSNMIPFPHYQEELFLADTAFLANAHCLTTYKGRMDERQQNYDIEVRKVRTGIERFFAVLDRHRLMHYCALSHEMAEGAISLLLNLESLSWGSQKSMMSEAHLNLTRTNLSEFHLCTCKWSKEDALLYSDAIKQYREQLCAALFEAQGDTTTRPSAHSREGREGVTKRPATAAELRSAFKKRRLEQKNQRLESNRRRKEGAKKSEAKKK